MNCTARKTTTMRGDLVYHLLDDAITKFERNPDGTFKFSIRFGTMLPDWHKTGWKQNMFINIMDGPFTGHWMLKSYVTMDRTQNIGTFTFWKI